MTGILGAQAGQEGPPSWRAGWWSAGLRRNQQMASRLKLAMGPRVASLSPNNNTSKMSRWEGKRGVEEPRKPEQGQESWGPQGRHGHPWDLVLLQVVMCKWSYLCIIVLRPKPTPLKPMSFSEIKWGRCKPSERTFKVRVYMKWKFQPHYYIVNILRLFIYGSVRDVYISCH